MPVTPDSESTTPARDIGVALGALRRRWAAAAAMLAVTLIATFAVSRAPATHYEATAQILLQQPEQVDAILNPDAITSAANVQREVNTNAQLITSIPVANAVRARLHLRQGARELISRLSVTGEATSNLVEITARDPQPDRAARVATAVAEQYQAYRRRSAQEAIGSAVGAASERLRGMDDAARRSAEGQALEARLHQLETGAAVTTGGVQVVRPATTPAAPAPRLKPLTLAIAVMLGLALAALAVAALERVDRRLLDERAVEAAFGQPVIARIPASRGGGPRDRGRVEAFDALAARLRFSAGVQSPRVILVAPAGPYAGDDVAIRLAEAMAELEPRVVLIDADLRHEASAAGDADLPGGGLTAILRRESTLEDELVVASNGGDGGEPFAGRAWALLAAGSGSSRPTGLLASREMRRLLDTARGRADVVIVAGPPLTSRGDALALAPLCDEILVAVRKRAATREHARDARDVLGATLTPVAGIVLEHGAAAPWSPQPAPDPVSDSAPATIFTPPPAGVLSGPKTDGTL